MRQYACSPRAWVGKKFLCYYFKQDFDNRYFELMTLLTLYEVHCFVVFSSFGYTFSAALLGSDHVIKLSVPRAVEPATSCTMEVV